MQASRLSYDSCVHRRNVPAGHAPEPHQHKNCNGPVTSNRETSCLHKLQARGSHTSYNASGSSRRRRRRRRRGSAGTGAGCGDGGGGGGGSGGSSSRLGSRSNNR